MCLPRIKYFSELEWAGLLEASTVLIISTLEWIHDTAVLLPIIRYCKLTCNQPSTVNAVVSISSPRDYCTCLCSSLSCCFCNGGVSMDTTIMVLSCILAMIIYWIHKVHEELGPSNRFVSVTTCRFLNVCTSLFDSSMYSHSHFCPH